jgi:hypothetical protein
MTKSTELSHRGPRDMQPFAMAPEDVEQYQALRTIGMDFRPAHVADMAATYAMDDQQGGITTSSIPSPIQFLQSWMTGFVRVNTAARKIDEFTGITTIGKWEDEEVVQGIVEPFGAAEVYQDDTNVPLASFNANYERRTVVRFEQGFSVGTLEEARMSAIRLSSANEKRTSVALLLDVRRNLVGFNGFNSGNNRIYGFLNDPGLPAYVTVAAGVGGTTWPLKTFFEIALDVREALATLRTQSQDTIDPFTDAITLGLPTNRIDYLTVPNAIGTQSVKEYLMSAYKNLRIVSAPQLNSANGGANVFYVYAESINDGSTDGGRVFEQMVPAQFRTLGIHVRAKDRIEDFSNATAGVMCKRPFAVVRRSGI